MSTAVHVDLIIVGPGRAPIRDGAILMDDDGRISHVGSRAILSEAAEIVELPGCTALPGLVNAHDHLRDPRPDPSPETRGSDLAGQVVLGVGAAVRHLAAGVTTVRTLGTSGRLDIAIRDGIAAGTIEGPRLVCAGTALTNQGGSPYASQVTGVDDAIAATEAEIDAGADVIKVFASRGVSATDQGGGPSDPLMTVEQMRAVVRRSIVHGIPVAAHAHGRIAIDAALEAGARTIEHGVGLQADQARRMAQEGVGYVPTMSTYRRISRFGPSWGLPMSWVRTAETMAAAHVDSVRAAAEAGVEIATGTDSFGDLVEEIEALISVGLTPGEALGSATATGAKVIGVEEAAGRIAPGMLADFLVVDGDPISSPEVLRDVRLVVSLGRIKSSQDARAGERDE